MAIGKEAVRSTISIETLRPDTAWEHQERAIYTVAALEKEYSRLLGSDRSNGKRASGGRPPSAGPGSQAGS